MTQRSGLDWILFGILTLLWASAYAFTRLAVSRDVPELGLPPALIISARLTLGAFILLGVAFVSGQKWPPLKDWHSWLAMGVMGGIGTAAPFYVITTAQQTVNSSLAALYVAAAPLFVAILAHLIFTDDRLTPRSVAGLLVGFCGVGLLLGPDAIQNFGSASVTAQLLCLLGTAFYAIATITARSAKEIPSFVFAAGFVSFAAMLSWPLLLWVDFTALTPSRLSLAGVFGLALGPTALASVVYLILVSRTRATFLSMTGYTIPVASTIIGYLAFKELQTSLAVLAFGLILFGIFLSQSTPRKASLKA